MRNGSAGAALMVVIGRGENCGRHDAWCLSGSAPAQSSHSAPASLALV
jgi:hypothetical protein